jgi:hypothetical protein
VTSLDKKIAILITNTRSWGFILELLVTLIEGRGRSIFVVVVSDDEHVEALHRHLNYAFS